MSKIQFQTYLGFSVNQKVWQKSTQQKITDGKTHLKMPGKPTQLKPTAKDEEGKKGVRDKAGRKSARGRQSSTAPLSAATTVFSLSFGCTLLAWLRAQGGNARSPPVEKRWLVIASFDYEKLLISRFLFDYRFLSLVVQSRLTRVEIRVELHFLWVINFLRYGKIFSF